MAKKLLLDSLTKSLGGIVDGINEENLKVGIWSGKVVLSNVALNVNAFKDEDLPVHIYSGSVESLEVSIPWTSLASEPVKVKISGVYLLAGPYEKDQLNQKTCQQRLKDQQISKLDTADGEHLAGLKKSSEEEEAELKEAAAADPGWAASLVMKIVDNIQITVESLHVRYEQYDKGGNCFACGVTMDSFTVRSTDKNWKAVDFLSRAKGEHKLYKKATLSSFAVYLDEKATSLCSMAKEQGGLSVRDPMRLLIARSVAPLAASSSSSKPGDGQGFNKNCYILSPLSIEVSAIRNEHPNSFIDPSVTASLKLLDENGYEVCVRKNAYHKFLEIAETHVELREKVYVLGHPNRPSVPVSKKQNGNPAEWFRFMANLVSHQSVQSHASRMIDLKASILSENPSLSSKPSTVVIKQRYLSLSKRLPSKIKRFPNLSLQPLDDNGASAVKKRGSAADKAMAQAADKSLGGDNGGDWLLGGSELVTLRAIEQALPLDLLITLRHEGNVQLESAERKLVELNKIKAKSKKSWWQFGGGGDDEVTSLSSANDVSIDELVRVQGAKAAELIESGEKLNDVPIPYLKCSINTFGSIKLLESREKYHGGSMRGGLKKKEEGRVGQEDQETDLLIFTATAAMKTEFAMDFTKGSYDAVVQLADLEIFDHVTLTPNFPKLITTQGETMVAQPVSWNSSAVGGAVPGGKPKASNIVKYGHVEMPLDSVNTDIIIGAQDMNNGNGLFVKVRSRSFIFAFNQPLVTAVTDFVAIPTFESGQAQGSTEHGDVGTNFDIGNEINQLTSKSFEQATNFAKLKLLEQDASQKSDASSSITVDMIAGAPKIVLCVNPSKDTGCLLLDCGTLAVRGGLGGSVGSANVGENMSPQGQQGSVVSQWHVSLSDINARMSRKGDLFNSDDASSSANILSKFNVEVDVSLRSPPPPLAAPVAAALIEASSLITTSSASPKPTATATSSFLPQSLPNYAAMPQMQVTCELSQPISGKLSPNQLNDLLFVLMNVGKEKEGDDVGDDAGSTGRDSVSSDVLRQLSKSLSSQVDSSSSTFDSPVVFNPYAVNLNAFVMIKQMQLSLTEEVSQARSTTDSTANGDVKIKTILTVEVDDVHVSMVSRSEDSTIGVSLKALSLYDLCRSEGDNVIVSSSLTKQYGQDTLQNREEEETSSSPSLIQIDYTSIESKRSPLLLEDSKLFIGKKIVVNFDKLNSVLIESSLVRLQPYYKVLMSAGQLSSEDLKNPSIVAKNKIVQEAVQKEQIEIGGGTTEFKLYINEISAELASEKKRSKTSASHLVPIMRTAIRGLDCKVVMDASKMMVNMSLDAISVMDAREEAKLYHYRHLIAPAFEPLKDASKDEGDNGRLFYDSKASSFRAAGSNSNEVFEDSMAYEDDLDDFEDAMSESQSQSSNRKPLLVLQFFADKVTNESHVDMTLCEFRSFFIVPSIVATLDVVMDLKRGIDTLLDDGSAGSDATNTSTSSAGLQLTSIHEDEVAKSSAADDGNSPQAGNKVVMKVNMVLSNLSLIVVENPSKSNTSGVVFESSAILNYATCSETRKSNHSLSSSPTSELVSTKIYLNVENLEAFVDVDMSQSSKLHVLDPTFISLKFSNDTDDGFSLATSCKLDLDDINLRISFEDIVLAMNTVNSLSASVDAVNEAMALAADAAAAQKLSLEDFDDDADEDGMAGRAPVGNQDVAKQRESMVSMMSFDATMKSFNLEFIDDTNGKTIPLMRMNANKFDITFQGTSMPVKKMLGSLNCRFSADVFNNSLSMWEEFVENWPLSISLSFDDLLTSYELSTRRCLNISLSDSMMINILNILNSLSELKLGSSDGETKGGDNSNELTSDNVALLQSAAENRIAPPYKLANATGCGLKLFIASDMIVSVNDNETKPFALEKTSSHQKAVEAAAAERRALSRLAIGQEATTSKVSLLVESGDIGPRKPIHGVIANVVHSGRYTLLPDNKEHAASGSSNSSAAGQVQQSNAVKKTVLEEIWQYQRRNDVTRNWKAPFMFGDPFEFSNAARSAELSMDKDFKLPSDQWMWLNDWSVHPIETLEEGYELQVDSEGWEYGTSFENMSRGRWNDRALKRDVDTVRRRRWTRIRGTIPRPLSDMNRPYSVLVETVKDVQSSGLIIRASSGVCFENHTGLCLEYGAESPGCWDGIIPFGTAKGNGDIIFLPLKLCDATYIYLREYSPGSGSASQSSSYWLKKYKIPLVALESTFAVEGSSRLVYAGSLSKDSHLTPPAIAFTYHYDGVDSTSCLRVELNASLVIVNKLPCSLEYAIGNSRQPFSSYPKPNEGLCNGMVYGGDVGKQSRIPLYDDDSVSLVMKINGSHWSSQIPFGQSNITSMLASVSAGNTEPMLVPLEWPQAPGIGEGGSSLNLCLKLSSPSPGRVILEVFSKVWISDRTGLSLTFGSKGALTRFKPKCPGSVPSLSKVRSNSMTATASNQSNPLQFEVSEDWALGKNGLALLHSEKDHVVVACRNDTSFARPSLSQAEVAKLNPDFNISGTQSIANESSKSDNIFAFRCGERMLELCMSVETLPHPFSCSKLVIFRNKYALLNVMEHDTLLVRQEGTPDESVVGSHVMEVPPKSKCIVHWSSHNLPKRLLFKLKGSTDWSYGGLPIDAIGGNALWLPPSGTASKLATNQNHVVEAASFKTVQVEVQLSSDEQDSAISIVVWQSKTSTTDENDEACQEEDRDVFATAAAAAIDAGSIDGGAVMETPRPLLSCRNTSPYAIELRQAHRISKQHDSKRRYLDAIRWVLEPGEEMVFGWIVPTDPQVVWVSLCEDNVSSGRFGTNPKLSSTTDISHQEKIQRGFSKVFESRSESLEGSQHEREDGDDFDGNNETMWLDNEDDLTGSTHGSERSGSFTTQSNNGNVSKSKKMFDNRKVEHSFNLKSLSQGKVSVLRRSNEKRAMAMVVVAVGGTRQLLAASKGKALKKLKRFGQNLRGYDVTAEVTAAAAASAAASIMKDSKMSETQKRQLMQTKTSIRLHSGIGLSIIDDNGESFGVRREILYASCDGLVLSHIDKGSNNSEVELSINHIQIDNHLKYAPYEVLLIGNNGGKVPETASEQSVEPFLKATFMFSGNDSIPYAAIRMLPISIEVDLSTVMTLSKFATPLLTRNDKFTQMATTHAKQFIRKYTLDLGAKPFENEDLSLALKHAMQSRTHYQYLTIHPIVIYLTFADAADMRMSQGKASGGGGGNGGGTKQSSFSNSILSFGESSSTLNVTGESDRSFAILSHESRAQDGDGFGVDGTLAQVLLNMASVSRAPLRLKGFTVEDAIESQETMLVLLKRHYIRGLLSQFMKLAGSMAAIGNPVDLASNVGGGVKSLFYEPLQGLVLGPKEFVKGIGRGGKGFLGSMIHGVTSSVAGVGDTVNKNLTMLAFDEEYSAERRRVKMQQSQSSNDEEGNAFGQGFKNAGKSVFGGVSSGITGIVSAPIKGAKKDGFGGFFKGVGQGLVGAVVKPVVGVTEGVTSVVQSVSDSTDKSVFAKLVPVRKRRAIPLLSGVGTRMVIVSYDADAAAAQYYAMNQGQDDQKSSKKGRVSNMYMGHVILPCYRDNAARFMVVVTTRRLVLRIEPDSARRYSLAASSGEGLPLSQEQGRKAVQVSIAWNDVSKCLPLENEGVVLYSYNSMESILSKLNLIKPHHSSGKLLSNEFLLWSPDEATRAALYDLLLRRRSMMGDSSSMPNSIFDSLTPVPTASTGSVLSAVKLASKLKSASSNGTSGSGRAATSEKPYDFGSANMAKGLPLMNEEKSLEEDDVYDMCRKALIKVRPQTGDVESCSTLNAYQKSVLDMCAWDSIRIWIGIRNAFNFKKLTILIFINESRVPVQVNEPYLYGGQGTRLVCDVASQGGTYDVASKSLAPGGSLYVLAWSFGPNPFKKQHVLFSFDTSAAQMVCSDMRSKCNATAKDGFIAALIESSVGENKEWSKLVVSVTSR